jgi:hypothetical protein
MRNPLRLPVIALLLVLGAAPSSAAGLGTFLYVHDRDDPDQIFGFSMDRDGMLAALPGSPFASPANGSGDCGGYCQSLSYSKKRKLLFSGHHDGLVAWKVAEDGTLALVDGSPFAQGTVHWGTSVAQRGRRTFVYSGLEASGQVAGYEVASDGTLVALDGSPFTAAAGTLGLRVAGKHLVAYNESDCSISSYTIGADGALTEAPDSPVNTLPTCVWHVNIDARGRTAYVGGDQGVIPAFSIDPRTSALTPLEGQPLPTGLADCQGGVALSRRVAVVGGYSGTDVQAFRIGRKGVLTALGDPQDISAPGGLRGHAFDASGRILALAFEGEVGTFAVDPATGALTPIDEEPILSASVNDLILVRR